MRHALTMLAVGFLCACQIEARPGQVGSGWPPLDAGSAGRRDAATRDSALDGEDAGLAVGAAGADSAPDAALAPLRVTLFSRTTGFRHAESIDAGRAALMAWGANADVQLSATEDPAQLVAELKERDVVVFLLTTGYVLDDAQQTAFETFIRAGGGYVGVHSAADTEYDWPFYGELVGAWFGSHPAVQSARMRVEASDHPAAQGLPDPWQRSDEWYNFRTNPRSAVQVILALDETSYEGGKMGADHPIAWSHSVGAGRALYTALGHEGGAWDEPLLRQHIQNAVLWAGGR